MNANAIPKSDIPTLLMVLDFAAVIVRREIWRARFRILRLKSKQILSRIFPPRRRGNPVRQCPPHARTTNLPVPGCACDDCNTVRHAVREFIDDP